MRNLYFLIIILVLNPGCALSEDNNIEPGAERDDLYLPELMDKRVGLVANHSSIKGDQHLADFLLSQGVQIMRIFSPEHGFRGNADAGASIKDGKDSKTGLEIVSLYGSHKKPQPEEISDLDIMVFDLQDVGVRFYTYISTLHYVMEACAEMEIPLIILDRPNPNANYIDGPVLNKDFSSFVGMHPVPVVYGMTIGEYGKMINGEGWLLDEIQCELFVVPCKNYNHSAKYEPPVPPSPNLPNYLSIRLYPSLCFFEGTAISVGRGTDFPFQVFGHPELKTGDFYFTPESRPGAAMNPRLNGEKCRGIDLRDHLYPEEIDKIDLQWIIEAYRNYPDQNSFFTGYFSLLSGNEYLQKQIEAGMNADEIKQSWVPALEKFKMVRKQYLLYNK
jgi:uncharacterized protein YbbC (DUF1343 family)